MSDDELPPPAFCGEDCPIMVEGCEDFCPVKAYGSEVAAKAREEGAKAERERWATALNTLIATESKRADSKSVDMVYSYRIAQIVESLRSKERE